MCALRIFCGCPTCNFIQVVCHWRNSHFFLILRFIHSYDGCVWWCVCMTALVGVACFFFSFWVHSFIGLYLLSTHRHHGRFFLYDIYGYLSSFGFVGFPCISLVCLFGKRHPFFFFVFFLFQNYFLHFVKCFYCLCGCGCVYVFFFICFAMK